MIKKIELFISHRTLQKHIIFSLCFKKKRSPSVYDFSPYLTKTIHLFLMFEKKLSVVYFSPTKIKNVLFSITFWHSVFLDLKKCFLYKSSLYKNCSLYKKPYFISNTLLLILSILLWRVQLYYTGPYNQGLFPSLNSNTNRI